MHRPAILLRDRSHGRCVLTGAIGFLGLLVAAGGEILLLIDNASVAVGAGLLAGGVVVLVLAEVFARRFWVLDTAGFRWEGSVGAELPWAQAGFITEKLSVTGQPAPGPEDNDRVLVIGADRQPRRWGRTVKHHQALTTVQQWHDMRSAYAQRRFDIGQDTKPFRMLVDGPELHTLRVRLRVFGQTVIAVFTLVAGLLFAGSSIAAEAGPMIGSVVLSVLLLTWFVVALRNLTSSVKLRRDGLLHRRWGSRRLVRWQEIAGVNVLQRPKAVSLVPLSVGVLLLSLWGSHGSGGDETEPLFATKSHPQLILTDGTGVDVTALATRSVRKTNRFAYALSLARRVGT